MNSLPYHFKETTLSTSLNLAVWRTHITYGPCIAFVPTRAFWNPKVLGFVPLRGEISCLLSPVLSSDKNKIFICSTNEWAQSNQLAGNLFHYSYSKVETLGKDFNLAGELQLWKSQEKSASLKYVARLYLRCYEATKWEKQILAGSSYP